MNQSLWSTLVVNRPVAGVAARVLAGWAQVGSNHRPLACKASALPLSYAPDIARLRPAPSVPPPAPRGELSPAAWEHRCCSTCGGQDSVAYRLFL